MLADVSVYLLVRRSVSVWMQLGERRASFALLRALQRPIDPHHPWWWRLWWETGKATPLSSLACSNEGFPPDPKAKGAMYSTNLAGEGGGSEKHKCNFGK